jgi:hypothetical protein
MVSMLRLGGISSPLFFFRTYKTRITCLVKDVRARHVIFSKLFKRSYCAYNDFAGLKHSGDSVLFHNCLLW